MHLIDWLIVCVPLMIVAGIVIYTRRFVTGVSDFLAAGRVAGRYVVAVSSGEAAMGLISVIALFELYYQSGFAINFWNTLATPVMLVVTLTGFAIYRYRETRALTMGQFFEIRYSKRFRLFAGGLQALSGILNYGLFPAVGARFLVYYLDLPQNVAFLGFTWPTFALLMAGFLTLAVLITTLGGQLTLMTSDCVMGILSYPMYLAVVAAIFLSFSWWGEMAPALQARPPGESMLNPFDVHHLRDFNLFYVLVGILASAYGIMSWSGTQGYNAAARNAHEQKMGRILGVWRAGFSGLMVVILAVAAYTYFNDKGHAEAAAKTQTALSWKALQDTARSYAPEGALAGSPDRKLIEQWESRLKQEAPGVLQTKETIEKQMRVPVALREILPLGVLGAFCAIMIFLMVSTDCSYLLSWGAIIIQDLVLPLRKRAFTPRQQLLWLRLAVIAVAVYAFLFSLNFGQVTYILMFFALTGSVYMGGAGAVILGGLYWKRGTAAGAWAAMLAGAGLAVLGFIGMNYWAGSIYPALTRSPELLAWLSSTVAAISSPLEPIIVWRVTPDKFFINGQEIYFLTMVTAIMTYVSVSLLTCREEFNMDRMLHRGQYARADEGLVQVDPKASARASWWKRIFVTLSGIDEQFSRGDKVLSMSVMIYSFGWGFGSWVVIMIWNALSPWPAAWWVNWFFIANIGVAALIGVVSTVWFSIGGTIDLLTMFRRLKEHRADILDDGRVIGHANAEDEMPAGGEPHPSEGKEHQNSCPGAR